MTAQEVIRGAIPDASDELCMYILWGRTPFPCGPVTAKSLYRVASGFRRARGYLCEYCERRTEPGIRQCLRCSAAIRANMAPTRSGL